MKKIVKKENIMKGAGVLLIVLVLLFSNLSVMANTMDTSTQTMQTNKSYVSSPLFVEGFETRLDENFNNAIPPDDWPDGWENYSWGEGDDTWYVDDTIPYGDKGYCATCYHDENLQDEWLILPVLNFTGYSTIKLLFKYYTSYYEAVHKDYHDLNVSISIDGGANWTKIWGDDNLEKFISWTWQFEDGIDLSKYKDNTSVLIGFNYYSANGTDGQEYSIDDIIVIVNSSEFFCDPGQKLIYHWDFQPVRFYHVEAFGGQKPYRWNWSFDDNGTGNLPPLLCWHNYDERGEYNVRIEVRDKGKGFAIANLPVEVVTGGPSTIQVNINESGIVLDVEFINVGTDNLSYINYSINIEYGLFGLLKIFNKKIANGTIEKLLPNTPKYIKCGYFSGFGRINIIISATPEGALAPPDQHFKAIKIGPLYFFARRG